MAIDDAQRQRFIDFMQQKAWKSAPMFLTGATIYQIDTTWLSTSWPVFYVGVTEDLEIRKQQHLDMAIDEDVVFTGQELQTLFAEYSFSMKYCTYVKNVIITACIQKKEPLIFTPLEDITPPEHPEGHWFARLALKKAFASSVLERERRWIFSRLQQGYPYLTNVERQY